ncbi:DUF202 domain-containing protein [Nitriliruptoraceae bacterium ZYF776]|nr:DUF202 domain-containing protein [Profundirhabdus halotolerans]
MAAASPAASDGSAEDPPGLQAERTALAWDRTALALAANGALLVRAGSDGLEVARVVGFVLLALAGAGLLVGRRRYLLRVGGATGVPTAPIVVAGVAAVGSCLAALASVVALAFR